MLTTYNQLRTSLTRVKNYITSAISGKADKSNVIEKNNTSSFTPTGNYHPATKKYVDDTVATHSDKSIASTTGAHSLRLYNGALQYEDNGTWKTLSLSDFLI